MTSRRALGRGLSSLIPEGRAASSLALLQIDVGLLHPDPAQPRKSFDDNALDELSRSLKEHGVLQPVVVAREGAGYRLILGERRWRAAVKAGLKTIPALVREAGNQQRLELALVENLQREELNPMEQARGCDLLMRDFSLDQEKVATILGKSRPFVGNLVRLLRLDPEIQTLVEEGKLSFGHAKVLAGLPRREDQLGLARLVIAAGLSVRETEARQARLKDAPAAASELAGRAPKKRRDPNVSAAEDRLRQVLGAEVRIAGGAERGAIRIEFTSAAELNRLFEILVRARPAPPPPLAAVKLPGSSPSPAPGER